MTDQPTIASWASDIADRVFAAHGFDVQSNKIARAMRQAFKAGLPAARVRPTTPVTMFLTERTRARTFAEWHEDHGDVLWWRLPVVEPPYVGSPLDLGFSVETHCHRGLVSTGQVGGWPYGEADEAFLFWVPIPVPELMLESAAK